MLVRLWIKRPDRFILSGDSLDIEIDGWQGRMLACVNLASIYDPRWGRKNDTYDFMRYLNNDTSILPQHDEMRYNSGFERTSQLALSIIECGLR